MLLLFGFALCLLFPQRAFARAIVLFDPRPQRAPINHTNSAVPVPVPKLQIVVREFGRITLSADGAGEDSNAGATIRVAKPNAAARVRAAFLACTSNTNRAIYDSDVAVDGNVVTWTHSSQRQLMNGTAQMTLGDVTPLVQAKVNAASPGLVNFILTEADSATLDGCALYTIFDNPAQLHDATVLLFFGGGTAANTKLTVALLQPLPGDLIVEMGVAIALSKQDLVDQPRSRCGTGFAEYTHIHVNNQLLTSCAGHYDDGSIGSGGQITVGGIGDSLANPADPAQQPADHGTPRVEEDERYNLTTLLQATDTHFTIALVNPGQDNNLFGVHLWLPVSAWSNAGIVLSPPAVTTAPVGVSQTVSATVFATDTTPISGQPVTFTVNAGPHLGVEEVRLTDADGEASFSYRGQVSGADTIRASYRTEQGDLVVADAITLTWTTQLMLTVDKPVGASKVGHPYTLCAMLTNEVGSVEPGFPLHFDIQGANSLQSVVLSSAAGCTDFTYTGQNNGEDQITIWVDANRDGIRNLREPVTQALAVWEPVTAITLVSFRAEVESGDVKLTWQTGVEIDTAGFILYRATTSDGPFIQVNTRLIAARGSGVLYIYLDEMSGYREGEPLFYLLEDVDFQSVATRHGPISVSPGTTAEQLTNRLYVPLVQR